MILIPSFVTMLVLAFALRDLRGEKNWQVTEQLWLINAAIINILLIIEIKVHFSFLVMRTQRQPIRTIRDSKVWQNAQPFFEMVATLN